LGRLAAVGGALRLWLEVGGKGIRKAEKIKAKIIAHRAERMEKVKDRIQEHENPVHFFFRINKRLKIFCQAPEIQLSAPKKQSFS
jgi:hypothetical protein